MVISTVLHPSYKLEYFKKAKWEDEWIRTAREITREEFDRSYRAMGIDDGTEVPNAAELDAGIISVWFLYMICSTTDVLCIVRKYLWCTACICSKSRISWFGWLLAGWAWLVFEHRHRGNQERWNSLAMVVSEARHISSALTDGTWLSNNTRYCFAFYQIPAVLILLKPLLQMLNGFLVVGGCFFCMYGTDCQHSQSEHCYALVIGAGWALYRTLIFLQQQFNQSLIQRRL